MKLGATPTSKNKQKKKKKKKLHGAWPMLWYQHLVLFMRIRVFLLLLTTVSLDCYAGGAEAVVRQANSVQGIIKRPVSLVVSSTGLIGFPGVP